MLASKAHPTYYCILCETFKTFHYSFTPRPVSEIDKVVPYSRQCLCTGIMHLVSVNCDALGDICGGKSGHWICYNTRHDKKYYPIPLRAAVNGANKYNSWQNSYWSVYLKIAGRGYPWRCPICGNPMRYRDEREIEGECQHQINLING